MAELTEEELNRYHRQIMLPGFGIDSQIKLKKSRVLMVGAGGLGCPVLQYLTAAGVGTIGIADFDKVEIHNLQRQILYSKEDVGNPKAEVAAIKLKNLNPNVNFETYNVVISKKNIAEIFSSFDVIIDGTDNFPTRYLINDTCLVLNKPLIFGSIFNYEAQLAVFNYNGCGNLRDIFPEPPEPEDTPGCNEAGVLGVVPGILGVYMANACIQVLLKSYYKNSLIIFDLLKFKQIEIELIKMK